MDGERPTRHNRAKNGLRKDVSALVQPRTNGYRRERSTSPSGSASAVLR